ncbi:hypothetical protein ABDK96_02025 [Citricoccus nitrophenolicus]|uniref:HNH nuclease domain-containing protein n=1 Tax=Citricoccus nitrophenolicus TaxID=863575 RepID=A0ABV0IEE8_9MICC
MAERSKEFDVTKTTCIIDGCDSTKIMARGWCGMHYKRWYKHGDPLTPAKAYAPKGATLQERLDFHAFDAVQRIEGMTVCHEWRGLRDDNGYGRIWTGDRVEFAHRVAYRLARGGLDDSADMMHQCDNPPCINADHLRPGDDALNAQEKVARGRSLNGELCYAHKLTDAQVDEIRAAYTGTRGQQARLAEQYGVVPSRISTIVNGKARTRPTNWRPGYDGSESLGISSAEVREVYAGV